MNREGLNQKENLEANCFDFYGLSINGQQP